MWLAIGLALLVVGGVVYRQAQQRLAEVAANTEADILSSHNLLLTAVAGQDLELFKSLLSGRNRRWTDVQMELARAGMAVGSVAVWVGAGGYGRARFADDGFDGRCRRRGGEALSRPY